MQAAHWLNETWRMITWHFAGGQFQTILVNPMKNKNSQSDLVKLTEWRM